MKITEILMAEHAVFHNLFDHIEAVAPRLKTLAEVKALTHVVEKVHEPHSKTEDDLFIEPLEHCFEQLGHNETFHEEHEIIEQTLAKVHRAKTVKEIGSHNTTPAGVWGRRRRQRRLLRSCLEVLLIVLLEV